MNLLPFENICAAFSYKTQRKQTSTILKYNFTYKKKNTSSCYLHITNSRKNQLTGSQGKIALKERDDSSFTQTVIWAKHG